MPVDRITVTVPEQVGREIRELAAHLGTPVSTLVTTAVLRELRQRALGSVLDDAVARTGPIEPETSARVASVFDAAQKAERAGGKRSVRPR